MKIFKKTYGAVGLMEWGCTIPVGKARLNVQFSGGTLTRYGNTPALYTTDDPIKQNIIENSAYFKSGKIVLVRTNDTGREVKVGRNTPTLPESDGKDANSDTKEVKMEVPSTDGQSGEDIKNTADETTNAEPKLDGEVEVTSLQEAKVYLMEKFGVDASFLKRKANILEVAAQNGVVFKGI